MQYTIPSVAVILFFALQSACRKPVIGCMDASHGNYDPEANEDDGCCCTIVKGPQDDLFIAKSFPFPFPNAPDTMAQIPVIQLTALVQRRDQAAEGSCGCLFSPLGSDRLEPGGYTPWERTYGPRAVCYTSINWSGGTTPNYLDVTHWNALAITNEFGTIPKSLRVHYTIRFEALGMNDVVAQFTDTLNPYFNPQWSSVEVGWGGGMYRSPHLPRRISCNDLPFTTYPIDNASVTIDLESIGFIP